MTTNATATPTPFTIQHARAAFQMLPPDTSQPRLTKWATPNAKRLTKSLQLQQLAPRPKDDEVKVNRLYGVMVIEDASLTDNVLIEARDQYGGVLGQVMA